MLKSRNIIVFIFGHGNTIQKISFKVKIKRSGGRTV